MGTAGARVGLKHRVWQVEVDEGPAVEPPDTVLEMGLRGVAVQWVGHLCGGPESLFSMVMQPETLKGQLVIHSSDVHAFSCLSHPERGAQLTNSYQMLESLLLQEEDLMKCLQMEMFCTGEQQQYPHVFLRRCQYPS